MLKIKDKDPGTAPGAGRKGESYILFWMFNCLEINQPWKLEFE